MISNSDCHSAALNRIGREFTVIETKEITYSSIISSLRQNTILQKDVIFSPVIKKIDILIKRKLFLKINIPKICFVHIAERK